MWEEVKTLKQALWEIVRDENIIITNQNIDWLLDRASKKATGDAQALKESILERKEVIEENLHFALTNEGKVSEKVKQIEEMARMLCSQIKSCTECTVHKPCLMMNCVTIDIHSFNKKYDYYLGEAVFLTQEEAEQALAKMKGGE